MTLSEAIPFAFLNDPGNLFSKILDEAFTSIEIFPGDIAVSQQRPIASGGLAVINTPDYEELLRIIEFHNDRIVLRSTNPRFRDLSYSPSDPITILGVVLQVFPGSSVGGINSSIEGLLRRGQTDAPGVWRADHTGGLIMIPDEYSLSTGVRPEKLLGWNWLETIHPNERDRVRAIWEQSVETGNQYAVSTHCRTLLGGYAKLEATAVPALSAFGEILYWEGRCVVGSRSDLEPDAKYKMYDLCPRKIAGG